MTTACRALRPHRRAAALRRHRQRPPGRATTPTATLGIRLAARGAAQGRAAAPSACSRWSRPSPAPSATATPRRSGCWAGLDGRRARPRRGVRGPAGPAGGAHPGAAGERAAVQAAGGRGPGGDLGGRRPRASITYVNQRMADLLGYQNGAMLGRPVYDFIDAASRAGAQRALGPPGHGRREPRPPLPPPGRRRALGAGLRQPGRAAGRRAGGHGRRWSPTSPSASGPRSGSAAPPSGWRCCTTWTRRFCGAARRRDRPGGARPHPPDGAVPALHRGAVRLPRRARRSCSPGYAGATRSRPRTAAAGQSLARRGAPPRRGAVHRGPRRARGAAADLPRAHGRGAAERALGPAAGRRRGRSARSTSPPPPPRRSTPSIGTSPLEIAAPLAIAIQHARLREELAPADRRARAAAGRARARRFGPPPPSSRRLLYSRLPRPARPRSGTSAASPSCCSRTAAPRSTRRRSTTPGGSATAPTRMAGMVDDLVQLAGVGRQDMLRRPVDLNDPGGGRGRATSSPRPEGRAHRVADRSRCRRWSAIRRWCGSPSSSLLSNAVKFTRPRDRATIRIRPIARDDQAGIAVQDNGVGFKMAYAGKLFGVFQRLHRPDEFEGNGAGLALVQRMAQRHGGRVWAESESTGATFYLTLGAPTAEARRLATRTSGAGRDATPPSRAGSMLALTSLDVLLVAGQSARGRAHPPAAARPRPGRRIGVARDGEEALDYLLGRGAFRHRLGRALPAWSCSTSSSPGWTASRCSGRSAPAPAPARCRSSCSSPPASRASWPSATRSGPTAASGSRSSSARSRDHAGARAVLARHNLPPPTRRAAAAAAVTLSRRRRPSCILGMAPTTTFPPMYPVALLPRSCSRRSSLPPPASPARPPIDIPFERHVLPNGLTLLVHEDHKAPIVAVNVWYHVGSKNERPGRTGFAHLFEHLMFNGSEHYDKEFFDAARAGRRDRPQRHHQRGPHQLLPERARPPRSTWRSGSESDRMGHLLGAITQAKLDEQRGVVQNEKRQGENEPYGQVWDFLDPEAVSAPTIPYSWTVIGSMEDLDAAKLDDVKDWFQTYYGAANAVLGRRRRRRPRRPCRRRSSATSATSPPGRRSTQQETWIAKRTGQPARRHAGPGPAGPGLQGLERARVGLGRRRLPRPRGQRALAPASRRGCTSGWSTTSRSRPTWRHTPTCARSAGSSSIQATVRPGVRPGQGRAGDRRGAGPAARHRTHAAGAARGCKTQIRAGFIRGVERIGGFGGKSDVLAQGEVFAGRPDCYKERLRRIAAATPAQVRAAAARWLSDGDYTLEVRPFPELPGRGGRRRPRQAARTGHAAGRRSSPSSSGRRSPTGSRSCSPSAASIPQVRFDLLLDAGYAADQFAVPGTASLAMAMLDEGTTTRTSLAISDRAGRLGANLGTGSRARRLQRVARGAAGEPRLRRSRSTPTSSCIPSFPAGRLRAAQAAARWPRSSRRRRIRSAWRSGSSPASSTAPGHAYRQPWTGSGTEESTAKLTRDDLVRFHRTWFKPNHATLVVVGATTMAEIRPKLERLFAGWQPGDVPVKNIAHRRAAAAARPSTCSTGPDAIQTLILAGNVAPPKANPDEPAIETMNAVLGGDLHGSGST